MSSAFADGVAFALVMCFRPRAYTFVVAETRFILVNFSSVMVSSMLVQSCKRLPLD